MMGTYHFLDHTADIAIRLQAESMEDLIVTAWEAWRNIVFENPFSFYRRGHRRFFKISDYHPHTSDESSPTVRISFGNLIDDYMV